MIRLEIQVPEARDRTAIATLRRGTKQLEQGFAAASASTQIASARGNPGCDPLRAWGHPPTGGYRLINHRASNKGYSGEYGMHMLLFEPRSGSALDAQAAGRVGLLVYGGPAGQDKRMRRTQGGVRISNEMLGAIIKQVAHEDEITLTIETLRKPSWWQFWKSMPDTPPLSSTATKAYSAPLDEMSIILELMNGAVRRSGSGYAPDERRDRDDNRWDDRSRSSSSSDSDTFRGGGGQSGGAGASGGWDSATTARGVDASGRIVAGAAIGAAAAVAASAAANSAAQESADTHRAAFSDSGSNGGSATGFHSSGSETSSTSSSTSTSY